MKPHERLLRLAVKRGGGLDSARKGPVTRLLTPDGQEITGVEAVEIVPFDFGNPFVKAHITVLIEIEAMPEVESEQG